MAKEDSPALSLDELTPYFISNRSGGYGEEDICIATRSAPEDAFSSPDNLDVVNSDAVDCDPCPSADGRELFFSSRNGTSELWRSMRDCL